MFYIHLLPLSFGISKIIEAEFSVKTNPLNNLGILFSINQILYILIAMWAFNAVPAKMLMILAIIFGAHLLPFSWLYKSTAYLVMSIIISISILIIGSIIPEEKNYYIALTMIIFEVIF